MRTNTPNKLQATRVEQTLKSLEVATKNYLKERTSEMKGLVMDSTKAFQDMVEQDWVAFEKVESEKIRTVADIGKKQSK